MTRLSKAPGNKFQGVNRKAPGAEHVLVGRIGSGYRRIATHVGGQLVVVLRRRTFGSGREFSSPLDPKSYFTHTAEHATCLENDHRH